MVSKISAHESGKWFKQVSVLSTIKVYKRERGRKRVREIKRYSRNNGRRGEEESMTERKERRQERKKELDTKKEREI